MKAEAIVLAGDLAGRLPGPPGDTLELVRGLPVLRVLAASRTTETAFVGLPGGPCVVRKTWRFPTFSDRVRGLFRTTALARSPARREAGALARLAALPDGGFAPRPLAVFEERHGSVLRECVLLLEAVEGAQDLAHWLLATPPGRQRRDVLSDLARRTRQMHAAGLEDRDMHPRNVLVVPAGARTYKVDAGHQAARSGPVRLGRALRDLAALDVGFVRLLRHVERVRFLRDYQGGRRSGARGLCPDLSRHRRALEPREAARLPLPLDEQPAPT